eukprot:3013650-Amphidinium_carterae.1
MDLEEFYCATPDVAPSANSCEDDTGDIVEVKRPSSKVCEQVGTCSLGGGFGVPEQLSDCPTDMVLPRQQVHR